MKHPFSTNLNIPTELDEQHYDSVSGGMPEPGLEVMLTPAAGSSASSLPAGILEMLDRPQSRPSASDFTYAMFEGGEGHTQWLLQRLLATYGSGNR